MATLQNFVKRRIRGLYPAYQFGGGATFHRAKPIEKLMSEELYGQPCNEAEAGYQPMPPATPLPDDDKEQTYSSDERGLAFCDDDGRLDTDLIRKVFERDTSLTRQSKPFG